MKESGRRPYEAILVFGSQSSEERHREILKKYKQVVEQGGGSIHQVDTWGSRRLANPIQKEETGVYFHVTFLANPSSIHELERNLRNDEKVLRFFHSRLKDGTDLKKYMKDFYEALAKDAEIAEAKSSKKPSRSPATA